MLGVAALVIAVTRRHALIDYAYSHTALVFVAAAVVVSAGALLVMATAALGRRE